jgi:hypothetical protein
MTPAAEFAEWSLRGNYRHSIAAGGERNDTRHGAISMHDFQSLARLDSFE